MSFITMRRRLRVIDGHDRQVVSMVGKPIATLCPDREGAKVGGVVLGGCCAAHGSGPFYCCRCGAAWMPSDHPAGGA